METRTKQPKAAFAAPARLVATRASGAAQVAVRREEGSCEAALAYIVALARAPATQERAAEGGGPAALEAASPPREPLEAAIANLPADVARKLRTLMLAGRDGKIICDVNVDTSVSDSQALLDAVGQSCSEFADHLRRGHAVASAAALDLERPISVWSEKRPQSLDERAWQSFGKQLATSDPADWQCLGFVEPGAPGISRLYLRLAEHAWWSFQTVMDRPSAALVAKQQQTLASRRTKGLSSRSLESIAPQLSSAPGRALRRAARAIFARLGEAPARI